MTELARVGLFADLTGETLTKLADRMQREDVNSGTVMIREGEPGDRFFVLLSGVAAVSQAALGERRILKAGEFFGEVALTMHVPRTATVTAMTPCVVASCDEATFDELVRPPGEEHASVVADDERRDGRRGVRELDEVARTAHDPPRAVDERRPAPRAVAPAGEDPHGGTVPPCLRATSPHP